MLWRRYDRGSRRPPKRPAAKSTKFNFCLLPNSFRQPMWRFCRDWDAAPSANPATRKRRRRWTKSRGCWTPRRERTYATAVHWHMVGQIQRNKARSLANWAHTAHSVSSTAAGGSARPRRGDGTERGPPGESAAGLRPGQPRRRRVPRRRRRLRPGAVDEVCAQVEAAGSLELVGLMGIPPLDWDPDRRSRACSRSTSGCAERTRMRWGCQPACRTISKSRSNMVRRVCVSVPRYWVSGPLPSPSVVTPVTSSSQTPILPEARRVTAMSTLHKVKAYFGMAPMEDYDDEYYDDRAPLRRLPAAAVRRRRVRPLRRARIRRPTRRARRLRRRPAYRGGYAEEPRFRGRTSTTA